MKQQNQRTRIEDLPQGAELSDDNLDGVAGGAGNQFLKIQGVEGESRQAAQRIEFKGSTIFSSGGTYDHDEGVCVQD